MKWIKMTDEDLQRGERGSPHSDPISLAIARALDIEGPVARRKAIDVDGITGINVTDIETGATIYHRGPWKAFQKWVSDYDRGAEVRKMRAFELKGVVEQIGAENESGSDSRDT